MEHVSTLENRLLQCQSAQILREQEPCVIPFAELKKHVENTRSVWAMYPMELQTKLAEAYAQESMRILGSLAEKYQDKSVEDWPQEAQQQLKKCFEGLSLNLPSKDVAKHGVDTFHGECVTFGGLLRRILSELLSEAREALEQ